MHDWLRGQAAVTSRVMVSGLACPGEGSLLGTHWSRYSTAAATLGGGGAPVPVKTTHHVWQGRSQFGGTQTRVSRFGPQVMLEWDMQC